MLEAKIDEDSSYSKVTGLRVALIFKYFRITVYKTTFYDLQGQICVILAL